MLKKTKFFDVECAYDDAYDLKQLRRILGKVIGTRVKTLRVFRMGHRVIRVVVEQYTYTKVDFKALQRDILSDQGVFLIEVAADGSSESLHVDSEPVVPSTIPMTIEVVEQSTSNPRRSSRRSTRPRTSAA